jgi:hypothetical protein
MQPERRHYAVLFGASMGVLMLELSFARTLSVALLSHYAFVAISLAMFGLGLAGLLVYLRPERFGPTTVDAQLAISPRRSAGCTPRISSARASDASARSCCCR